MKIDPKFYSEKNTLYFLNGSKAEIDEQKIKPCQVKWTSVGLDEDSYNEEFLANLREQFKSMEENDSYAFVVPVCDSACDTNEQKAAFVASMKHCARRIKDCENIIGFEIPAEADSAYFMEELSAKHSQYIYFTKNVELAEKNEKIVKF